MLMHEMRRAPELSATTRSVSIWIIASSLHFGRQACSPRPLDDPPHAPALARGQRTARDDLHDVADAAAACLVVRHELAAHADVLVVARVQHATVHLHDDGLLARDARDRALLRHAPAKGLALLRLRHVGAHRASDRAARDFSPSTVRLRAMVLRTSRILFGFSI